MSKQDDLKMMRSQLVADAELLRLVRGRVNSPRSRSTDLAYLDGVIERMFKMAEDLDSKVEVSL